MTAIFTPEAEREFVQKCLTQMAAIYVDSIVSRVWPHKHGGTTLLILDNGHLACVQVKIDLVNGEEQQSLMLQSVDFQPAPTGMRDTMPAIEQTLCLLLPTIVRGLVAAKNGGPAPGQSQIIVPPGSGA